ncbi:hypothetical protein [Vibrio parahaemolyticus]|uniref:hypothetical protein n=1 Tax=Vibrio parahaemolyticus TaxID=670 RepID=UPI000690EF09|nr:hypothetical protein [Vibrio parahaemolyticus]
MSQLITSKEARYKKNHAKMATVIQFLKQEVYSDMPNLMLLLSYKDRAPLDRLLNKLISLEYIQKHVFEFQTGKISIWGITDLGLTQNIRDKSENFRTFKPNKVTAESLERKLVRQKKQISLKKNVQTVLPNKAKVTT